MRFFAYAALLVLLMTTLAGCLAPEDSPLGDNGSGQDTRSLDQKRADHLEDQPTYCSSEDSCDFWDDMYHQYVVYDLDTYEFNVLVVPPTTADPLVHTQAARLAVEQWRDGILHFAEPWLKENFTMDVYVAGEDIIPQDVTFQIVVLTGGVTTTLVGIGLEPKQFSCIILGEGAEKTYPTAFHHGWERRAADCTGIGFTCFAINVSGAPGEERDLYDLVAHEVGHCLGAGHVGDALDFRARYAPPPDIMSYSFLPEQVGCVSNMNTRVLEGVYGHLLDRPEEEWLPRGSYLEFDPLDYEQYDCENPPSG